MSDSIAEKVDRHFSQYKLRKYPKGQILIHSGNDPQVIYYLVSGKVRQYDVSYRGDEIIVNMYKSGAFFPMIYALTQKPNRYYFEAETDVEARIAPLRETVEYLRSNADVQFDLLTRVYIGMDGLLGRMFHVMSGSARSRLLYELLIECRRFGKKTKDGGLIVEIHEGDLAARSGLTRETISREIHKIDQDGLITVSRKGITVADLDQLEKLLGVDL